jgi:hypothetical protein
LISRIFNQPKAKLAIGGNTFIIGPIVGIELPFIGTSKISKEKIEAEIYKTPIEKATSLLNTLEQKNYGKRRSQRVL